MGMCIDIPIKERKQSVCSVPFTAKQGQGTSRPKINGKLLSRSPSPLPPSSPLPKKKKKSSTPSPCTIKSQDTGSHPQGKVREQFKIA